MPAKPGRKRFTPQQQTLQCLSVPTPRLGMNLTGGLMNMSKDDAIVMNNLMSTRDGLVPRPGYYFYGDNTIDDTTVKTLMPWQQNFRLFCGQGGGIYQVVSGLPGQPYVLKFVAPDDDPVFGRGTFITYSTIAAQFGIYVDENYGYFLYTASTNTWTRPVAGVGAGEINGADPSFFSHVGTWKTRLWFTLANSTKAYYLPVGSITGTVTVFDFGPLFQKGGDLVGVYTWTIDGGQGVDDYLLALSTRGDAVIFKGTDPAVAGEFVHHGTFYVGELPQFNKRCVLNVGGELYILTAGGVVPMSKVLNGMDVIESVQLISARIQPLLQQLMTTGSELEGWELVLNPQHNCMLMFTPTSGLILCLNLDTKAWCLWSNLAGLYTAASYKISGTFGADYFYAGIGGVIRRQTRPQEATNDIGTAIRCTLQTSFLDTRVGNIQKVEFIRPICKAGEQPDVVIAAPVFNYVTNGSQVDQFLGPLLNDNAPKGAVGMGQSISVLLVFNTVTDFTLVRIDLLGRSGGLL